MLLSRASGINRLGAALGALLLLVSSGVHFYLYDIAYQDVATLGPLFLVQASSAIALALLLVLWPRGLVVLGAFGLMAGTIVGFILVRTLGLFGFTLTFTSGWALLTLVAESVATLVLFLVVARLVGRARQSTAG
jgi:hypothetical protein